MTPGNVVAAAAFPAVIIGLLWLSYREHRAEVLRLERLRRLGDDAWVADEVRIWRLGVDPCPPSLFADLAEPDADDLICEIETFRALPGIPPEWCT